MTFFIISSEETFNNLRSFDSVGALNEAVRKHIKRHKKSLNQNAIRVLKHLKQYSCKYIGVSFQSKGNIAKELNISRRTVIRACQLLERLGIIRQYEMKRKSDMQQTSNAIVIQPFVDEFSENVTQEVSHQENNISCLKQNNDNNNVIKGQNEPILDSSFVPAFVDENFVQTAAPFFNAKEIYRLWLRVLIAYRKSKLQRPIHEVIGTVNKAFKHTVFMYKQGKIYKSFEGYFYRLLESYFFTEKCRERKDYLYNWLEA